MDYKSYTNKAFTIQDRDIATDFVQITILTATFDSPYDEVRIDVVVQTENFHGENHSVYLGRDDLRTSIADLEQFLLRGFESSDKSAVSIHSMSPGGFTLSFRKIFSEDDALTVSPPFILIKGSVDRYLYSKSRIDRLNLEFYLVVNEDAVRLIIDEFQEVL